MLTIWIVILWTAVAFYNFYWKRRNLPPGPTPLPILGNGLTIGRLKPGYDAFIKWSKQYGPVYTYWLAENPIVAVADYNIMHDVFVKDPDGCSGREFFNEHFAVMRGCLNGIVLTEGDVWRVNRRFAMQVLRDYGMGRNIIESKILLEVQTVIDRIRADVKSGVDGHNFIEHFDLGVGSVIGQFLFGHRFSEGREADFHFIKHQMDANMAMGALPLSQMCMSWPFLRHLPKRFEANDEAHSDETLPFVGSYFRAKRRHEEKNSSHDNTWHLFRDDSLRSLCIDLWTGGLETTSNSLAFMVLYLMLDQESQCRMHAELDAVVGSERQITLADRSRLPYVQAVETQRLSNLLPQNLHHKTMRDVNVNGMLIPEGTRIDPQIACVLYDEKVFPEPHRFKPERFLDENGHLKKVDELIPFSLGKRQCPGESLARMELFLFAANIFNQFRVFPVDPLKPPSVAKEPSLTVRPQPYKARVVLRHD
ncbi:Protein CYP-33C1 [Aphelenchoides avenae]|nr:Protein CYP-33C1 [Aphelenchus avenae]